MKNTKQNSESLWWLVKGHLLKRSPLPLECWHLSLRCSIWFCSLCTGETFVETDMLQGVFLGSNYLLSPRNGWDVPVFVLMQEIFIPALTQKQSKFNNFMASLLVLPLSLQFVLQITPFLLLLISGTFCDVRVFSGVHHEVCCAMAVLRTDYLTEEADAEACA